MPLPSKSHLWNVLLGPIMFFWQAVQPPINPLAFLFNVPLEQAVSAARLKTLVPNFTLAASIVNMVITASMGLVTFSLLIAGIILAVRRNPGKWRLWQSWAAVAGMVGLFIAFSQVVPMTIGRAYCGFLFCVVSDWAT